MDSIRTALIYAFCIHLALTFGGSAALVCLDGVEVPVECNAEACRAAANSSTVECGGEPGSSYCLAATYTIENETLGIFQCVDDVPDHKATYCQSSPEEAEFNGNTCNCISDGCNSVVYMSTATLPPESTTKPPEGSTTKDTHDVTKPQDKTEPVRTDESGKGPLLNREILVIVVCSVVPAVLLSAVIAVAGYIHVTRYRQPLMDDLKTQTQTSNTESTSIDMTTDESETKYIGEDSPPDSPLHLNGNYFPITLDTLIGKGRFGAVWKADWKIGNGGKERTVAVKVFFEYDSASWNVEKELFTDHSVMMRHENIVQFIAAEVRRVSYAQPQRQYWLITKYYKNGSLYDYLCDHTVSWFELCKLAGSMARGLAHLHAETYGSQGLHKVPVAHRDLKSTNVLVKDDGTCAIADFGLAVRLDPQSSTDELANSGQVGTPRYMSPEALECKVNLQDIQSFKQMDQYALALILWEIASRCTLLPVCDEYKLPFSKSLGDRRASLEEMKVLVVQRRERPPITEDWLKNPGMAIVKSTVVDCWDEDPEARLTASCVEARFQDLILWVDGEPHAQSFYGARGRRGRTTLV